MPHQELKEIGAIRRERRETSSFCARLLRQTDSSRQLPKERKMKNLALKV
jgi:hypothetical protein